MRDLILSQNYIDSPIQIRPSKILKIQYLTRQGYTPDDLLIFLNGNADENFERNFEPVVTSCMENPRKYFVRARIYKTGETERFHKYPLIDKTRPIAM